MPDLTNDRLSSLLLDNLRDYAIFMLDLEGKILTWTPGVKHMLGYTEAEFVGQSAEILFFPEDREAGLLQQEMQSAHEQGRFEVARWCLRKDGKRFWASGPVVALRDEAGVLRGFSKILRDDTSRLALEAQLQEVTSRLQSALDAGSIGTWRWDIQNDRVAADVNLARFFCVSDEDARGGPIAHYTRSIHFDDLERVLEAINDSIELDTTFAQEYRLMQADGSILWVEARGKVKKDAHGHPKQLDGVVLDITERKSFETALKTSEERYRELFNSIDSGFCVIQMIFDEHDVPLDYRFLEINPAFERQTGLVEAVGRTALDLVPNLDRFWFETYGKVALSGEPIRFENGAAAMQRWFDVYAFPTGEPGSHKVAILFTDITMRKQGEDALRQARFEAEETNRLKDEFLATLSHELRTPLNAILGWSNLLQEAHTDEALLNNGLEVIERNARAQAQLIDDLLDVSRILTGKLRLELQPLQIRPLLEDALLNATPTAKAKRIRIHSELTPVNAWVSGDSQRLAQIFWNLFSNAIKFTPRDGEIWVKLAIVESQVQIQVIDSGCGISPEFLLHVFERFRQADASSTRTSGGLGIGLGLVKYLVEGHGGTVEAQSAGEGQGATFVVTLPLLPVRRASLPHISAVEREEPDSLSTHSEIQIPSLEGIHILVVDDEKDARDIVAFTLKRRGANVETADSVATAFAMLETTQASEHPFDILVSDIGMPREDGYSLIRRLRLIEEHHSHLLPAIALTAYASPKDRMKVLMAGFQNHLSKPVDALELVTTVASLVHRPLSSD